VAGSCRRAGESSSFVKLRGIPSLAEELLVELVTTVVRLCRIRWTEHVESVKCIRHERPEKKGPLGRPWHRWVDNIKM
jgi:hypothetical protein